MFDAVKNTFRQLKAIRDWLKSETAQALSQHTDTYLTIRASRHSTTRRRNES